MAEARLLHSETSHLGLLVDYLNEFKSEDEDSDQYWYLLGLKLAELNVEKYQYTKRLLVDIGQSEEKAPDRLLADLVEKEAFLEDVIQCLEKIQCKKAVDLLYRPSSQVGAPVEEVGSATGLDQPDSEVSSTPNLHLQDTETDVPAPRILTHPKAVNCKRGDTVEFSCVSDTANAYVWYRNKRQMEKKKDTFCQKLTLTNVGPEEEALYSCRVTNAAGTVTSDEAKLSLNTDIEISQEPEAKQVLRICGGEQQVHLACQAQSKSGSQLKYEWQKIDHKGDPKVVGFSSEVDVTVVHKELDCRELKYRCKIIDGTDSTNYTYSHPVVVKIETVWITQELKDVSAKVNTPTSLRFESEGYSYCIWLKSSTGENKTLNYFKETKLPVLHFANLSADDGGYYACNLYHKESKYHVTTRTARLKPFIKEDVKLPPVLKVLRQPYSCTVRKNSTLRLYFEVSCSTQDTVTHQWYLNGQKLNGDTIQDLKRDKVTQMQCGSYQCEARVGEVTVTSDKAVVNLAWQESQPSSDSKKYRFFTGEKSDSTGTFAHSKVALLIGNQNYENLRKLRSPENDITALAKVLRDHNFQVFALVDLNFSEMQAALAMFYRSLVCNTYALFYFCGHGFNDGAQTSYMTPVDYPSEPDPTMGFHMSKIITSMQEKKCRPLCIMDACRLVVRKMQPQIVDNIKDTTNFLCICSTGEDSSAVDIRANDSDSKPVSPFNKALRKAIESGCKITELPEKIMQDYEGTDVRGQFRDGISLQDEISVSMDEEGDELVKDLQENNKHYKNCISVPEKEWVPTDKNAELVLEFSSVLTNVWQLKVIPILNDSSDTTSVQVEFDKPYLESQGVSLVELDKNAESQGISLNLLERSQSNDREVELRGVQKLEGPLKIMMELKMDGNGIGKCVYESSDVPSIARQMKL